MAGVEVKGLRSLADGTKRLADDIGHDAEAAAERVLDDVAARTRTSVPRVSGAMAASVGVERMDGGAFVGYLGLEYPGWVEFGGSRGRTYAPGGRWLPPAAAEAESEYVTAATRATQASIDSFRWPGPY